MPKIYHFSSYGKRQEKYDLLNNSEISNIPWQELELTEPYYFFVPKDFGVKEKYDEGFSISEIFKEFNSGIESKNDSITMQEDKNYISSMLYDILKLSIEEVKMKYHINDTKHWKLEKAIYEIINGNHEGIQKVYYRPFDFRYTILTHNSGTFLGRSRFDSSKHLIKKNLALVSEKNHPILTSNFFVSDSPVDSHLLGTAYSKGFHFPLYLYNQQNQTSLSQNPEKTPNFNFEIISKIEEKLKLKLNFDFTPENLFDYIYAVLHSKTYRETFKEFLKIDFPKIPFNCDKETFFKLAKLGEELRSYHLLENPNLIPKNFITKYDIAGSDTVENIKYLDENVYVNETQCFSNIPKNVWEFYIGGYQPAQKWLKDRKTRKLNYEDIIHYRKIIMSLSQTIKIMDEIEEIFKI